MPQVKTAISIPESLLKDVNTLAENMQVTRSWIFEVAARDLLEKRGNRRLLDRLNEVYKDGPTPEEKEWQENVRIYHRKLMEGQW